MYCASANHSRTSSSSSLPDLVGFSSSSGESSDDEMPELESLFCVLADGAAGGVNGGAAGEAKYDEPMDQVGDQSVPSGSSQSHPMVEPLRLGDRLRANAQKKAMWSTYNIILPYLVLSLNEKHTKAAHQPEAQNLFNSCQLTLDYFVSLHV